jgi:hypothetical protein
MHEEMVRMKKEMEAVKKSAAEHDRMAQEARDESHRRMSKQLEAESVAARCKSELERCEMRLAAKEREMAKVVEVYKDVVSKEQKRAEEVELDLQASVRDFALIRDNLTRELGTLGSDRQAAVAALTALQDRLGGEEERCRVYQKQLTDARKEMGATNRAMADVAAVNAATKQTGDALGRDRDPDRLAPAHKVHVRELDAASVEELRALENKKREQLMKEQELETLKSLPSAETVLEENRRLQTTIMQLQADLDRAKAEAAGAATTSGVSSSIYSDNASESSGCSSPSDNDKATAGAGGGGSGKKKRRMLREQAEEREQEREQKKEPENEQQQQQRHLPPRPPSPNPKLEKKIAKLERELDNSRKQLIMVE